MVAALEKVQSFSAEKCLTAFSSGRYISEPARGRRHWQDDPAAGEAVYANRRRIRGTRGRRLLRRRGEYLERPFAHAYQTGGLRRVYLRGRLNILKRVLIHVAALNLGLLMRVLVGVGTPRSLQGRVYGLFSRLVLLWRQVADIYCAGSLAARLVTMRLSLFLLPCISNLRLFETSFTTGC